jgi:mannosyltransferase
MAIARPFRVIFFIATGTVLWILFTFAFSTSGQTRLDRSFHAKDPGKGHRVDPNFVEPNLDGSIPFPRVYRFEANVSTVTHEPAEPLRRVVGNNYAPNNPDSDRANATLLALVRNSEVDDMIQSMRDLEITWNYKFNYPWLFLNDVPFTEEFKKRISAETKAKVSFEVIPEEHWNTPEWINPDLYESSIQSLKAKGVLYMGQKSYHNMCRWNSGMFYKHPALKNIKWYWRVEPKVHFFCQIDYDVFRWMEDHNKTYGFTINLYDGPDTVKSLWPETMKFVSDNNQYLHQNNAIKWLQDSEARPENNQKANGYSTCHFWSNFEIGNMDFWRSEAYEKYFEHLDRAGGFYYERWGDAPVHSIALGLFEDKSKIHWFRDIGYQHIPFFNCPNSPKCHGCLPGRFTDGAAWLHKDDCRSVWFKEAGMG